MKFTFLTFLCFVWLIIETLESEVADDVNKKIPLPTTPSIATTTIKKTETSTETPIVQNKVNSSLTNNSATPNSATNLISTSLNTSSTPIVPDTITTVPPPKTTTKPRDTPKKDSEEGLETDANDETGSDNSDNNIQPAQDKPKEPDSSNGKAIPKPNEVSTSDEPENSHFMAYFLIIGVLVAAGYVAFYKRKKILGLVVEGRRSRADRKNVRYRKLREGAADDENGVQKGNVIY